MKEYKFYIYLMVLNLIANFKSSPLEENSQFISIGFEYQTFLIVSIFILAVYSINKSIKDNIK